MNKIAFAALSLAAAFSLGSAQAAEVARAVVTTAVEEREPANDLERLPAGTDKVFFFTELRDMAGQSIKHRWSHDGEVLAEVEFAVGGSRWRVWSSKNLMPAWSGEWTLAVIGADGTALSEKRFVLAGADEASAEVSAAEPVTAEERPMQ